MRNSPKSIDYRFKILYALGIIFIVSGHCNNGGISAFYEWFPPYSFHLGLFVFSSGYFYNPDSEDGLWKYVLKKVKKILVPLYLWNLFYGILSILLKEFGFSYGKAFNLDNFLIAPITTGHQFILNLGGWFMVPLFMVEIFNCAFRKFIKHIVPFLYRNYFFAALYLSLGVFSIYLSTLGHKTGWWLVLNRMLFFLPFYGIGFLYKSKLEQHDKLPNLIYFASIFTACLIIVYKVGKIPTYVPSWCDYRNGIIMPYITGFLGIAFWLRVAKILEPAIGRSKIVNLVANNTYSITINHYFAWMLLNSGIAVINKLTTYAEGFKLEKFKSAYDYFYCPGGSKQFYIVYLFVGIAIPILMQLCIDKTKGQIIGLTKRKKIVPPTATNETVEESPK